MQTGYALRQIAPPRVRAAVQETSDEALVQLIADGDKRAALHRLFAGLRVMTMLVTGLMILFVSAIWL